MSLEKSNEQRYLDNSEYQRNVDNSKQLMAWQPANILYLKMKNIFEIISRLFPVFSIVFASTFVAGWFVFFNIYVAYALALVILVLVEYLKNQLMLTSWKMHFANIGRPLFVAVFAVILSGVSFVTSYNGAGLLMEKLTDQTQTIETTTANHRDSIAAKYNKQIALNNAAISDLRAKAKNQWKGLNTPEQDKQINNYLELNKGYEVQKSFDLQKLDSKEVATISKAKEQTLFAAHWNKLLAGFIELVIIMANWFLMYYAYITVKQHKDLEQFQNHSKELPQPEPIATNDIKIAAGHELPPDPEPTKPQPEKRKYSIGFAIPTKIVDENRNDTKNDKLRTCENCSKNYTYRHHKQKYCCDECIFR